MTEPDVRQVIAYIKKRHVSEYGRYSKKVFILISGLKTRMSQWSSKKCRRPWLGNKIFSNL